MYLKKTEVHWKLRVQLAGRNSFFASFEVTSNWYYKRDRCVSDFLLCINKSTSSVDKVYKEHFHSVYNYAAFNLSGLLRFSYLCTFTFDTDPVWLSYWCKAHETLTQGNNVWILFIDLHKTVSLVSWAKLPHTASHVNHVIVSDLIQKTTDNFVFIPQDRHFKQLSNRSLIQKQEKLHAKIKTIIIVFVTGNLHCTRLGSSCPCRSLWCCSAQLWKKRDIVEG